MHIALPRLGSLAARSACVVVLAGQCVAHSARAAPAADAAQAPAVWQHHARELTYFGTTAQYTCRGIEDKTRAVLQYFGARRDLKVSASCPELIGPVLQATVHIDFYALAPAPAGASDTVPAHWAEVRLMPRQPAYMGRGECEFVHQVKDILTKDFALRDVQYRTACTPHQTTLQDYRVRALALQPLKE